MATGKNARGSQSKGGMDWSGTVRPSVVQRPADPPSDEPHIPWSLLVAVLVMCLVLVIALPIMGVMYMDMNNATIKAMEEVKKMRELRAKILLEMSGE
jgi:hypothetical protein